MSGLDIEGALAAHVDVGGMLSEEHGYQKYVCLCGEGDDDYRWHRAHVAAVLREQIAAWLESDEAEVAAAAGVEDYAYPGLSSSECERTARYVLDALAAQVAPSRVPGEGS